jgi:hypothetical protein
MDLGWMAALMALMLAVASSSAFACGSKVKGDGKDGSGKPTTESKT